MTFPLFKPFTIMDKQQAVSDVVTYHTLPPQIDYTQPWWIKAVAAQEFIDSLPEEEKKECNSEIQFQTDAYYTPGECGHSAAELDAMF